uniref:Nucleoside phosphorylase domain-containing protein n=1 Tax=Rhodosorus marinus TaxID=101924 RepID=A0A7S3E885_9RHOD|mmetsp:Transcript_14024/g.56469  ORF Transcript_14024/g.56469 Transcript_14024/m.56469 type:complete len:249 (+) Transcript_14024:207-953(+)
MTKYGRIAVIGGTSLLHSNLFDHFKEKVVETEHGNVIVYTDETGEYSTLFIQRHHADATKGAAVYNPPHVMNQKSYIAALKSLDVSTILGVCSVGSLTKEYDTGTLVVPDDFFNQASITYFDDARGHLVPAFSEKVRQTILTALGEAGPQKTVASGTYVQTVGPRFETKAEVRFLSSLGDVIGMTAASEAVLALELGMDYAVICMIDNYANGLVGGTLTEEEFRTNVKLNEKTVETAVQAILKKFYET